jgi:septal ring factor EnvC (AmiA/AmiB activator)
MTCDQYSGELIDGLTRIVSEAEENAKQVEDIRKTCEPIEQERRRKRGEKLAGNLGLIFMVGLWLYFCHSAWMELAK